MVKHFFHNIWSGQVLLLTLCWYLGDGEGACISQELWGLYRWGLKPSRAGLGGGTRRNPAHGPPCWGLGVGLTTPPRKNKPCYGNYDNYNYLMGPHSRLNQTSGSMTTSAQSLYQAGRGAKDSLLGLKTKISIGTWNENRSVKG